MNDYTTKSYWFTTRSYSINEPLKGTVSTDVLVIGGGYTGLSTAYHVKRLSPGSDVTLIESDIIGYGASGRNAGFIMTLFGFTLSLTKLRFGQERARDAQLYMQRAVDYSKELIEQNSLDCEFEYPGFLRVATTPHYVKRLQNELNLAEKLGLTGIRWIDKDNVREKIRSDMYLGALYEDRCGLVNPAKFAWELKRLCEESGVHIYENTPAESVKLKPSVTVKTPGGVIHAEKIMIALNAYSLHNRKLKRRQIPVTTHIVLTRPLNEKELDTIDWKERQGIEDARNLVHYYRLTRDNRLLMGGGNVALSYGKTVDRDPDEKIFTELKNNVRRTFPVLDDVEFTHRWSGPVSVPIDMSPAMGYVGDKRAVYSYGCVGHGVSITQLNGKVAAELLLENYSGLSDIFFVNRKVPPWPPEPFRYGLSFIIKKGLQLEDTIYERNV